MGGWGACWEKRRRKVQVRSRRAGMMEMGKKIFLESSAATFPTPPNLTWLHENESVVLCRFLSCSSDRA